METHRGRSVEFGPIQTLLALRAWPARQTGSGRKLGQLLAGFRMSSVGHRCVRAAHSAAQWHMRVALRCNPTASSNHSSTVLHYTADSVPLLAHDARSMRTMMRLQMWGSPDPRVWPVCHRLPARAPAPGFATVTVASVVLLPSHPVHPGCGGDTDCIDLSGMVHTTAT